uniref:Reverse transcriptase Ty1/copia-type domain-containing protein n=1 Tax=Tanacetum cinerariifolium TaxID=118510 RepID=A0A6L2P4Q5_TANCI|nr:hypothetical protein [Tanacetum cinerariifolium]
MDFKKKTDMNSNVHIDKARLVAKGFTQTYGVDYAETFPPVADIRAINILITIADPGELHWTTVKTILKYLRNTKDMFLVYGGNLKAELRVDCYCDAGFETDRDDTKSQTEAAYIAASKAGIEVVRIRKFISRLSIVPTINEPIKIFYDNLVALHFAYGPGFRMGHTLP